MVQVALHATTVARLGKYLKTFLKYSTTVTVSLAPTGQITFSAVNENASCFSSVSIHPSQLARPISSPSQHENDIFQSGYRVSLKALWHFIHRLRDTDAPLIMDFTPFALVLFLDLDDGASVCWKGAFESVPLQTPLHPPLTHFPHEIVGLGHEWFEMLVATAAPSGILPSSAMALTCLPATGIRMQLLGPIAAQVTIGHFNMQRFRVPASGNHVTLVVSLREFLAFMSLSRALAVLVSLYFTLGGQY